MSGDSVLLDRTRYGSPQPSHIDNFLKIFTIALLEASLLSRASAILLGESGLHPYQFIKLWLSSFPVLLCMERSRNCNEINRTSAIDINFAVCKMACMNQIISYITNSKI